MRFQTTWISVLVSYRVIKAQERTKHNDRTKRRTERFTRTGTRERKMLESPNGVQLLYRRLLVPACPAPLILSGVVTGLFFALLSRPTTCFPKGEIREGSRSNLEP